MYYWYMTSSISSADARKHWSETLDRALLEPVEITARGRVKAVLVGPEFLERALEALEDAEDIADAREVMGDGEASIPWEDVQRDLGLFP